MKDNLWLYLINLFPEMPRNRSFTYRQVVEIVKSKGCYYLRCRGSHESWRSPITNDEFVIIKHKNEEIRIKTFKTMVEKSGIGEEYFMSYGLKGKKK